jgi:hypothetical protein
MRSRMACSEHQALVWYQALERVPDTAAGAERSSAASVRCGRNRSQGFALRRMRTGRQNASLRIRRNS